MRGHSGMTVLDPQTFAASTLADSKGLAAALRILESCLAGSDTPLDLIIQDLCSVPNLLEFIISASPSGRELVSRVIDTYPTNPALVEASYTSTLLQRLSSVIFALPPDLFPTLTVRQIGQYKVYVEVALPVLILLCSTDFSTCISTHSPPTIAPEDPEYDEEFSGFSVRKKQKQSKRENKDSAPAIDMTPFHKLGRKVPSNRAEASEMAREISEDLKMILKFCLELLFDPSVAQQLKDAYISTGNDTDVHPTVPQKTMALEVVESKPSAYPKVQPIKTALYFENVDKLGEWRIIIGTNATKKLRELANGDREKCNIVLKKIRQLSHGHFSDKNQKWLNGSSGVPIFEAEMQRDLCLVYQIDVVLNHDGNFERQVIKIYGIYTHTKLNRIWDAMGQHLAGNGKEYSRRCVFRNRPIHPGGDVYLPASFPPESLENDAGPMHLALSDDDKGELHSLLVLEKYITFSQAFLHSLIVNQDMQHVFELHPQERRIVDCITSCYVLGRSGTGKTTTMLFKMLRIEERERQIQASGSGMPKRRQIFVTKSGVLATKVEEYFTQLLESSALAGHSLGNLKKMRAESTETGLVDIDDIERVNIPQKFSLLEESHFPLFVTFDKLAQMIAADVLSGDDAEVQRVAKNFVNTDEIEARDSFVTYDIFARTYWSNFPCPLRKGLEPWLVFSEFMGVIKGSEKSLSCPEGFLDEATYCGLSARSNPIFANHRPTLYALFQAYCKLKKERHHHDVADRTHAILKALLRRPPLKEQKVDFLYVDEAQDNLLIDALLLRLICRNPEGLFWAGDTAQTISAGSSFRFDDLKAFMYRMERDQSSHLIQGRSVAEPVMFQLTRNHHFPQRDQSSHLIQGRSVAEPVMFQLTRNHRSHGGIVDCAHSVIERIMHFWPDAIDRLKPEHGTVAGWKPVFFRSWDQDTVRYEQFLFGESGNRIEFGAQQCILVRDEKAQEKLRQEVGEVGLVMTLDDSKGLEFNDVLLYNFFEDSAVDASRWSVLLNDTEGEVDGKELATVYAPSFGRDEGRFAGVRSELKFLYVGITRARKNLWIFDKSDKSEPMRMIWTSRNQVHNCTPGTDVPHLAVSSTPDEWVSLGHHLFQHKKYPQAMHCFARALRPCMEAICEAFHLRELARAKVGVAPLKAQEAAFFVAAGAFTKSANDAPPGNDKLQYYRNAAECYVRAGDDRKAAIAYISAEEYDLGARRFRKAGLFDETLEVLHKHSHKVSSDCSEELFIVCRLFYCSKRDGQRPRLPLFLSLEEEEEFLENYDLDFARAELLASHGRYLEAAEIHLAKNRPLNAIKDLLKEKGSRDAIQKATKILLDGLWHRCSFAIAPKDVAADQDVTELLDLARKLPVDLVGPLDHHEISMFQAIARADFASLGELANEFIRGNRKALALLSLDHFFSQLPGPKSYEIHQMSSFLAKFLEYEHLLHSIISDPDPLNVDFIKQLFCIKEESNTKYGLQLGSFLHSSATDDRDGPLYSQSSVLALSRNEVSSALRKYLAEHLRERSKDVNFTSPSDVPSLLSTQLVVARSELCFDAPAFILRNVPQIKKVGDGQKGQPEEPDVELEPQGLAPATDEPALIREHEPTEREISAAKRIQAAYRRYRRRCEALTHAFGRGLKAQKNTVFAKCLKNVYASNWGKTPYRTLYLWALPQLVVCLESAMAMAHDFKTTTKGLLLKEEGHDHLEELGKKTSQISALLKNGHLLQKRIEPNAIMHQAQNRDKATLKKVVLDVKNIIDHLPVPALAETQEDFDFVYELVVVEKQPRIKDVNFTSPSDVPSLLSTQLVVARSELCFDAPAFILRNVPQIKKVGDGQKGQPEEPDVELESQELAPATDEPVLIREHEPTEREISAAKRIQAAYRRYRRRCEALTHAFGRGHKAQKNTVFAKCLKNVYASNWGKTPYRTLYLWALPQLVVCLERAMDMAHDFKTKTKGLLLKEEGHDHLEELGKETSQISAPLKNGHLLQKRIEPNAIMHQAQNRDKAALKKVVLDVKNIIDHLPVPAPAEIQEDFDFVYELVVVKKQQAPKSEKPDLNTEDLDLYYYCQQSTVPSIMLIW